jgi:phosphoglycerate dehydrogenase-like enzyme
MKRYKIVADDKIPFLKGVLDPYVDVVYLPGAKISPADVADADAIFTRTRTYCNKALLHQSNVRLIVTATIGYDHIDTAYCENAGIRWINAPGCNSSSVHQYITTALLVLAKEKSLNLQDMTLGVIGVGNVGSKVAKAGAALGMCVLLNDPPRAEKEGDEQFTALDKLLEQSDVVTCHTPLTKEGLYPTYHLSSFDFFNRMKDGAVYINTSRGAVTDSAALRQAALFSTSPCPLQRGIGTHNPLQRGIHYPLQREIGTHYPLQREIGAHCPLQREIGAHYPPSEGAGGGENALVISNLTHNPPKLSTYILDVWEGEPDLDSELLENALIGTPHIAGYSSDGKANGTAVCVREFCRFFELDILPDWYPDSIPAPPMPTEIHINCDEKTEQQVYYEAVTHTYPIWEDYQRLKQTPTDFEKQRGDYWIRREFGSFTIHLKHPTEEIVHGLGLLGFRLVDTGPPPAPSEGG